jgi:5-dehydro-2-deoxygluconokinase
VKADVDIWILGRIGYDLYAVEHNRALSEVEHFVRDLGGSSANMAVGLARLGLKVGLISAVGDDLLADYLLSRLRNEGVDARYVARVPGYNTSLCLTEVWPPSRFNQVFYRAKPADSQIALSTEAARSVQQAKTFITNGTSLAAAPARDAALQALKAAHEAGVRTVLDVDYRNSSWPSAAEAGEAARRALRWVEVVFANEEELALLAESDDAEKQIESVLAAGPKILVQKLGARGVAAHTATTKYFDASRSDELVCAIGGGDGFASGFLYALYCGYDLARALAYGNAAGAVVVSRVSCSAAMPRLEEIEARLGGGFSATASKSRT